MIKDSLKTIALSLAILSLISVAYAWTEPSSNPPAGNVSAPINTSGTGQIKSGSLQVNGFRNLGGTALDGTLSVGGNITSGGRSVITSLSAGSGISISGSGNSRTIANTSGSIGSGTANYLSKWTSRSTLGNSVIYDDGTNVGIGTTPAAGTKLRVQGSIRGNLGTATVVVECYEPGIGASCADEGTPNQICRSAFGNEWKAIAVDCECVEAPGPNRKLNRYMYNNLDWCCDSRGEDFTVSCYQGV